MPEPNQQNSKATVGVEVPEAVISVRLTDLSRVRGELELACSELESRADHIKVLMAERDSRLTKEAAGELVAKLRTLAEQNKSLLNSADGQRFEPHLRGQHVGLSWAYGTAADMLDAAFGDDR